MTSMLRTWCLGAALLVMTSSLATASDQSVSLRLGTSSTLAFDRSFTTILIADPHVVDVQQQGDHTASLEPLTAGSTVIVFVDVQGIVIANVRVFVCGTEIHDRTPCPATTIRPKLSGKSTSI